MLLILASIKMNFFPIKVFLREVFLSKVSFKSSLINYKDKEYKKDDLLIVHKMDKINRLIIYMFLKI